MKTAIFFHLIIRNERISAKTFISHAYGAYLDLLNEESD